LISVQQFLHIFGSKSVVGLKLETPGFDLGYNQNRRPLWIGCARSDNSENDFQCFIEPSKPFVRKWFSKIEAGPIEKKLAAALEAVLLQSGKVSQLGWH